MPKERLVSPKPWRRQERVEWVISSLSRNLFFCHSCGTCPERSRRSRNPHFAIQYCLPVLSNAEGFDIRYSLGHFELVEKSIKLVPRSGSTVLHFAFNFCVFKSSRCFFNACPEYIEGFIRRSLPLMERFKMHKSLP